MSDEDLKNRVIRLINLLEIYFANLEEE